MVFFCVHLRNRWIPPFPNTKDRDFDVALGAGRGVTTPETDRPDCAEHVGHGDAPSWCRGSAAQALS